MDFYVILKNMVEEIATEVGLGYPECVYKNALKLMFRNNGFPYEEERVKSVKLKGEQIGTVRLDLIVDDHSNKKIIIELKAIQKITDKEINQVQRYQMLTQIDEAYIVNFSLREYSVTRVSCKKKLIKIYQHQIQKFSQRVLL